LCHFSSDRINFNDQGSCFWSFYVKWLEQGGARVAVIRFDETQDNLKQLFSSINGLLFTGGEISLNFSTQYVKTANYLYSLAIEANQNGDYFPVWGTCLGFELLNILTSQDENVLSEGVFDSDGLSLALNMTPKAETSRMFGNELIPSTVIKILTTQNVTENLHHSGVTPANFTANEKLNSFYNILSTNRDREGKEFVSTMEGKNLPVYGTQWHPERPQFEWEPNIGLDHSLDAVYAMQYVSNFFIQESRKSNHSFANQNEEDKVLIYAYTPVYIGDGQQIYYFPPSI